MAYRWFFKKQNVLLASLVLLLTIAVACGGSATATSQPTVAAQPTPTSQTVESTPLPTATTAPPPAEVISRGGTLRAQSFVYPRNQYTPHVHSAVPVFSAAVYSLMVEFDPTTADPFDIRPDLAKSWEISEDGSTYTFRLSENVRFHDGTPLTADDVVYSLDRMRRLRGPSRTPMSIYYDEGNSRAIDQNTVALTTKFPTMDLLAVLGMESSAIVSEAWQFSLEEGLTDAQLDQKFGQQMGSGPFKPGKLVRDVSFEVVKNDDYYREGFPLLDAVRHIVIFEKGTLIAAYKTEQVLMSSYPLTSLTTREAVKLGDETDNITVHFTPPNNIFPLRFNTLREPLNDPRVRQAISLALHRQAFRDVVGHPDLGKVAPPVTGIRAAGPWGRTEEEISLLPGYRQLNGEKHPDDIAAARQLLADAGFPDGFTIEFLVNPAERPGVVPLFTDQLKEYLNVTMETSVVDSATAGRRIEEHDLDMWVDGDPPLIVTPDNWLFQAYMPGSGININSGWEAPQWFQDAVWEQAQELDAEKRLVKIRALEDYLMNEDPGPLVVTFWEARHVIINEARVNGFNMPALSLVQLKFEHLWCDPC